MSKIIDGKAVSAQVKERIKAETAALKEQGIEVGLAVVIVGEDPASKVYVKCWNPFRWMARDYIQLSAMV